jgi:hypothetical protein
MRDEAKSEPFDRFRARWEKQESKGKACPENREI